MTDIKVSIPQNLIDEAAGKELATAQRKIKALEGKVAKLEKQEAEAKYAIDAFKSLRSFLANEFDLYEDYGY